MKKKLFFIMALLLSIVVGVRAQQALPYEYGFEDNNLTTDGWELVGATSTSTGILANTAAAHSGSNGFRFNYSEQNCLSRLTRPDWRRPWHRRIFLVQGIQCYLR